MWTFSRWEVREGHANEMQINQGHGEPPGREWKGSSAQSCSLNGEDYLLITRGDRREGPWMMKGALGGSGGPHDYAHLVHNTE